MPEDVCAWGWPSCGTSKFKTAAAAHKLSTSTPGSHSSNARPHDKKSAALKVGAVSGKTTSLPHLSCACRLGQAVASRSFDIRISSRQLLCRQTTVMSLYSFVSPNFRRHRRKSCWTEKAMTCYSPRPGCSNLVERVRESKEIGPGIKVARHAIVTCDKTYRMRGGRP